MGKGRWWFDPTSNAQQQVFVLSDRAPPVAVPSHTHPQKLLVMTGEVQAQSDEAYGDFLDPVVKARERQRNGSNRSSRAHARSVFAAAQQQPPIPHSSRARSIQRA